MIVVKFDDAGVSKRKAVQVAKRLVPELMRLAKVRGYDDSRASVFLPVDESNLEVARAAIALKRKLHPSLVIVIGIGGSNLGALAVQEAVLGKLCSERRVPRLLFADTVDSDELQAVIDAMQGELRQGRQVLLNVISKSGSTTETVANFEILLNVLRRHRKNAQEYVVVTTDRGSSLWEFGLAKGFSLLEIPKNVGGRYSVFSQVGLFPLGMVGVDIKELVQGAAWMRERCLSLELAKNPAAFGASVLYLQNKAGRSIYDHFLFATDLESLGKWYRQLLAESVGKEFSVDKKRVRAGIAPTVSVGSVDLHSLAQLYLGGPDVRFTNFVTTRFNAELKVPNYPEFEKLVKDLQGKELVQVLHAIVEGVKRAYRKAKRPFSETHFDGKNAFAIGAFMQWKMIETMLLAQLLQVNPFDQPAVELYKKETRMLLRTRKKYV